MASPQAKRRSRPYRDFLTPSLHRRFFAATLWSIALCLVLAIWMSLGSGFWSFTFMTILRTATLFICPLLIFILRVGNVHVGSVTTSSPFTSFYTSLTHGFPLVTFWWYGLSAMVFCETYIWSCGEDAKFEMVDRTKYERPRLNERPVFLRTMFLFTAFVTSALHLYYDRDRVPLQTTNTAPLAAKGLNTLLQLRAQAPAMLQRAATLSIALVPAGLAAYFLVLRGISMSVGLMFAQQLFRVSHGGATVGIPGLVSLIGTYAGTAFVLLCFWELTNTLYDIQIAQPPLKLDQPLTADSKDPNGSLILGLKGRKEFAGNMAFWELVQITDRFEVRRQTFFKEPDREGGSTWSQVSQACLGEIRAITQRIEAYNKPAVPQAQPPPQVQSLPKIGQPLKSDDIYTKSAPKTSLDGAMDAFGNFAKAHGNSPGATDPVSPRAKRLLTNAKGLLTPDAQRRLQPAQIKSTAGGLMGDLLRSPIGFFFRQTFARRATAVICGSPLSRTSVVAAAVEALTQLVVHSLKEDSYGAVQRDVLVIVKTLAGSLQAIQGFLGSLPVHWTDVDFKEQKRQNVKEVQEIQHALSKGLERLLMAYGEYLPGLGASAVEMKNAKALVAHSQPPKTIEMQEAR